MLQILVQSQIVLHILVQILVVQFTPREGASTAGASRSPKAVPIACCDAACEIDMIWGESNHHHQTNTPREETPKTKANKEPDEETGREKEGEKAEERDRTRRGGKDQEGEEVPMAGTDRHARTGVYI